MHKLTTASGGVHRGGTAGYFSKVLNSPSLGGNQWDLLQIKGLFGIINEEKDFAVVLNFFFVKSSLQMMLCWYPC